MIAYSSNFNRVGGVQLEKFDKVWTTIEYYIVGILSLTAILIGFYGIIMRYIFVQPIGWSEEVIIYLMAWALLIILSPVQRDNEHIRLDMLYNRYPQKAKPFVDLFIILISLIFVAVVIIYGLQIVESLKVTNQLSQSTLQMPLWIIRLSVPVGFALFGARLIQSTIVVFRDIKNNFSSSGTN